MSTDKQAIAALKRADARAARLGRLIDRQYELARQIEIAATSYVDAGQFTAQDMLRLAGSEARNVIVTLERARDIASRRAIQSAARTEVSPPITIKPGRQI